MTLNNPSEVKILHPSFFQYLGVFVVPLVFFSLGLLGVSFYGLYLGVLGLEAFLLLAVWVFLATTVYVIHLDRVEIRRGILVKRSWTVPFEQITNVTCRQGLFQKLFGIGNVSIDTANGKPFEMELAGVANPEGLVEYLFALKERGGS